MGPFSVHRRLDFTKWTVYGKSLSSFATTQRKGGKKVAVLPGNPPWKNDASKYVEDTSKRWPGRRKTVLLHQDHVSRMRVRFSPLKFLGNGRHRCTLWRRYFPFKNFHASLPDTGKSNSATGFDSTRFSMFVRNFCGLCGFFRTVCVNVRIKNFSKIL